MIKKNVKQNLLHTCRIIVGLVFLFSGFVKGVDPLGTTYKLTDYFQAFHMEFLTPFALAFSILLNMSEFVLGMALIFGVFTHFFIRLALVYMGFFTPLTLILAFYDPVTDCGCFGDALVMTNWQTFYKNLIILALVIVVFRFRKTMVFPSTIKRSCGILTVAIMFFVTLSAYSYMHLPALDFRPYKTGNNIPEGMSVPVGAPADSFSYVLTYKKGDILKEFSINNLPIGDSTWKWVETKTELIREGYHPPIHDFAFSNMQGEDVTDSIIQDPSYVFLAITYNLEEGDSEGVKALIPIFDYCDQNHYNFFFASASTSSIIEQYKKVYSLPFNFYSADEIMLKTVVRSNPGLVLIRNGTIINKWHFNDFPSIKELEIIVKDQL